MKREEQSEMDNLYIFSYKKYHRLAWVRMECKPENMKAADIEKEEICPCKAFPDFPFLKWSDLPTFMFRSFCNRGDCPLSLLLFPGKSDIVASTRCFHSLSIQLYFCLHLSMQISLPVIPVTS